MKDIDRVPEDLRSEFWKLHHSWQIRILCKLRGNIHSVLRGKPLELYIRIIARQSIQEVMNGSH